MQIILGGMNIQAFVYLIHGNRTTRGLRIVLKSLFMAYIYA
jgi:hypothetical protein